MSIPIVQENAEDAFLAALEEHRKNPARRGALLCRLSRIHALAPPETLLGLVKDELRGADATIYLCHDGDVAIAWRGGKLKKTFDALVAALTGVLPQRLKSYDLRNISECFDVATQAEDLLLVFRDKRDKRQTPAANETAAPPPPPAEAAPPPPPPRKAEFSDRETQALRRALAARGARSAPDILIVEDQGFSQKLLTGMLKKDYRCHTAKTGVEALAAYAELAPCITFVDVELPDVSGHALAALFRRHDPQGFVVMVTANNYVSDVETAKANGVQGFIAKPYNKQKILSAIDAYRKRARSP